MVRSRSNFPSSKTVFSTMYLKCIWSLLEIRIAEWKNFITGLKRPRLKIQLFYELCISFGKLVYLSELFGLNGSQISSSSKLHDFKVWSPLCQLRRCYRGDLDKDSFQEGRSWAKEGAIHLRLKETS